MDEYPNGTNAIVAVLAYTGGWGWHPGGGCAHSARPQPESCLTFDVSWEAAVCAAARRTHRRATWSGLTSAPGCGMEDAIDP